MFVSLRRSSFLIVLFALQVGAQAATQQSFFVTGTVRAKGGAPLSGELISMRINGIMVGAVSGDAGRYRFSVAEDLVHGQAAMLEVRLLGYRADSVSIRMDGDTVAHDFELVARELVSGPLFIIGPTSTAPPIDHVDNVAEIRSRGYGLLLSGRVTGAKSGAPVEGATVSLCGSATTATDADGQYALSLPAEQLRGQFDTLTVRLIGYAPVSRQVTLSPGAIKNDFALVLKPIELTLTPIKPAPAIDWMRSLSGVSRSSGWPNLETGPHEKGLQEIRVWPNVGTVMPQTAYQLTRRGKKSTGEIVRYERRTDSATLRSLHSFVDSSCTKVIVDSVYVCHLREHATIDWSRTWDSLKALHVWTIPDEADTDLTEPIMNDGADITVELWDGKRYRVWGYNTNRMFGKDRLAQKRDAGEIWKLLGSMH